MIFPNVFFEVYFSHSLGIFLNIIICNSLFVVVLKKQPFTVHFIQSLNKVIQKSLSKIQKFFVIFIFFEQLQVYENLISNILYR